MFIHNMNISKGVDFIDMKARIFMFKVLKSWANGDSDTLEFMCCKQIVDGACAKYSNNSVMYE